MLNQDLNSGLYDAKINTIPKDTLLLALGAQLFLSLSYFIFNIVRSGHYNSIFQLSYVIMSIFTLFSHRRMVLLPPVDTLFLVCSEIKLVILADS